MFAQAKMGGMMVDLFRQLADDADDIADLYRREAANSAAERDQIKTRLAKAR